MQDRLVKKRALQDRLGKKISDPKENGLNLELGFKERLLLVSAKCSPFLQRF